MSIICDLIEPVNRSNMQENIAAIQMFSSKMIIQGIYSAQ
jgi:hypothetical protein